MNKEVENSPKLFSTSHNDLKIESELHSVDYSEGYFFISQKNLKIAVLDTFFKRQHTIEDSINKFPIEGIYKTNDSVIVLKNDDYSIGLPETYYLTNDFKLKLVKEKFVDSQIPGEVLFEDSSYKIFVNRTGEAGFFTYFLEKSSRKIYAIFSNSPRQVVKFKDDYYIFCDEVKHNSSNTGIIKVKNPKQFLEITIQQAEKLNILLSHLAVSPGKEYELLAEKIRKQSLNNYGYLDRYSIPIYSFEKENELYTIIKNDSLIYLGKHIDNKIVEIQKLFDISFEIDNIFPIKYNSSALVIFNKSGRKMSQGKMLDYFDCGFFNIKNSRIDLYRLYKENISK